MTTKRKPQVSQAEMIKRLLARRMKPETIVKRVRSEVGGRPTVGYVNYIASHA
jgi:hypothetical protein